MEIRKERGNSQLINREGGRLYLKWRGGGISPFQIVGGRGRILLFGEGERGGERRKE